MNPQIAADLRDAFRCSEPMEYLAIGAAIGILATWAAHAFLGYYSERLAESDTTLGVDHFKQSVTRALRFLHLI